MALPAQILMNFSGERPASAADWSRDFREQLRNPFRREYFDFLFRKARVGIALRENVRNEIVRLLASLRRALLELGDRLVRRGVLTDATTSSSWNCRNCNRS